MTTKIDYKRQFINLYKPSTKTPSIIEVPGFNFLMIDGHGNPNTSSEFKEAVSALYSLAYAIKFHFKKSICVDYAVMPLEGLWWVEDMSTFSIEEKESWLWTMMIMQPEMVLDETVEQLREQTLKKKKISAISKIRFETYHEGTSVQLMHVGPFSAEGPNIKRMHQFAIESGYEISGNHHEIYLNDFTRTTPEKLKTILRQPLRKA